MSWTVFSAPLQALEVTTDTSDSSTLTDAHEDGRPKVPQISAYKSLRHYMQQLTERIEVIGEQCATLLPGVSATAVTVRAEKAGPGEKSAFIAALLSKLSKLAGTPHAQLLRQTQAAEAMLLLFQALMLFLYDEQTPLLNAEQVATAVTSAAKQTLIGFDDAATPLGGGSAAANQRRVLASDIRIASLFTIAMLAHRHAELLVAHWNVLFPDVDACKSAARHTLFTPLLHDRLNFARSAAAAAINHVIAKTHSKVQLAAEPSAKRQSFTSLSGMVSKVLLSAHQVFVFGICHEKWPKKMRIMYLPTFAAISSVTPYERLPQTRAVLLNFLRDHKSHDELFSQGRCEGLVVCASLAAIFRNPAAVRTLTPFLNHNEDAAPLLERIFALLPDLEAWKAIHSLARNYPFAIAGQLRSLIATLTTSMRKADRAAAPKELETLQEGLRALSQFFITTGSPTKAVHLAAKVQNGVVVDASLAPVTQQYFADVFQPALRFAPCDAVRMLMYRATGQLDDSFFARLELEQRREVVSCLVDQGLMEPSAAMRRQCFEAIAQWSTSHPSMAVPFFGEFCHASVNAFYSETNETVAERAAMAISNLAAALAALSPFPVSEAHLLATAAAVALRRADFAVQAHGIRAFGFILHALPEDDLIMEIDGHPDGICNAGLECFATTCRTSTSYSMRIAAAIGTGLALSRREVFACDPVAAKDALNAVVSAARSDHTFKVRASCAMALRVIHPVTFAAQADVILGALCVSLASSSETTNFTQFKESQVLRAELVDTLRVALRSCGVTSVMSPAEVSVSSGVAGGGGGGESESTPAVPRNIAMLRELSAKLDESLHGSSALSAETFAKCMAIVDANSDLLIKAKLLRAPPMSDDEHLGSPIKHSDDERES